MVTGLLPRKGWPVVIGAVLSCCVVAQQRLNGPAPHATETYIMHAVEEGGPSSRRGNWHRHAIHGDSDHYYRFE